MNNEIQDERYFVAEEAIYDAFLLILEEKDLEKITVTDIIKKAGIVRTTFYNHYENIPTLVNAVEDKTLDDIFSLMKSFHPRNDRDVCKTYFLTICEYTMTNPFLTSLLKSPRGDRFFEKALTMFHTYAATVMKSHTDAFSLNKTEFSYIIASSIGSTIGVLHKWTMENCETPAETIAEILTQVFMAGMLPLIS